MASPAPAGELLAVAEDVEVDADHGFAEAIVKATTFYDDPDVIAKVSRGLGEAMVGINLDVLGDSEKFAGRGW